MSSMLRLMFIECIRGLQMINLHGIKTITKVAESRYDVAVRWSAGSKHKQGQYTLLLVKTLVDECRDNS